ncbi:MAG: hypothetical protein R3Y43_00310 [Alphaproteobacteria bacterium]
MKKFLFLFIFFPTLLFAQEKSASYEKVDLSEKAFFEQAKYLYDYSKQLNEAMPEDKIDREFSDNIQYNFKMSDKDALKVEKGIRFSIKASRAVKKIYDDVKMKFIAPPLEPRELSDEELEKISKLPEYKESEEPLVTNNFLRTIPYSFDRQNFKVMRKKYEDDFKDIEPQNEFDAFRKKIANIDYRSWFNKSDKSNDLKAEDEVKNNLESSAWLKRDDVSFRLLSSVTKMGKKPVLGGVHFNVKEGYGILYKPDFSFEGSENLEKAEVSYFPPSIFTKNNKSSLYYFGNFALPIVFYPKDNSKEMIIRVQLSFDACTVESCVKDKVELSLKFEPGIALRSPYKMFLQNQYAKKIETFDDGIVKEVFKAENGDIVVNIDEDYKKNITYVYLLNQKTFLPTIKITNDGFSAVFKPDGELVDDELEIMVYIDNFNYGIYKEKIQKTDDFFMKTLKTGFYINFYPWMFVLLFFVLYSLPNDKKKARKELIVYCLSVLAWFSVGVFVVLRLPFWGIWLSNSFYLITVIAMLMMLVVVRLGWVRYNLKFKSVFYGFFVVMLWGLSTNKLLFENPNYFYLGLGFLLPYFLFLIYPNLIKILPKPSETLSAIANLVNIALLFTILWLLLSLQSWSMFFVVIFVFAMFKFYSKVKYFIEVNNQNTKDAVNLYKNKVTFIALILLVFCLFFVRLNIKEVTVDIANVERPWVRVIPNWCMSCKFDNFILNYNKDRVSGLGINVINLPYNLEAIKYMKKFDVYKPPFSLVMFDKNVNGLILPSFFGERGFKKYIF